MKVGQSEFVRLERIQSFPGDSSTTWQRWTAWPSCTKMPMLNKLKTKIIPFWIMPKNVQTKDSALKIACVVLHQCIQWFYDLIAMPFVSVIRSIPIIALNGELLHLHTYPPEIVTLVFECLLTIYLKLFMSFPFLLLFLEPRFLAKDPALKQKDNFEFRRSLPFHIFVRNGRLLNEV